MEVKRELKRGTLVGRNTAESCCCVQCSNVSVELLHAQDKGGDEA